MRDLSKAILFQKWAAEDYADAMERRDGMSDPIARAKAINEKYQAEVAAAIYAINKAIVLIGVIVLMGVSFWVADQKIADTDRTNQEQVTTWKR